MFVFFYTYIVFTLYIVYTIYSIELLKSQIRVHTLVIGLVHSFVLISR